MSSFHKSDGISLNLSSLNCDLDIPPSIETFWLPPFVSWGSSFFFKFETVSRILFECITWLLKRKDRNFHADWRRRNKKKKEPFGCFSSPFWLLSVWNREKTSSNQHWPSSKQAIPSQFNCAELCWAYPFWRRFSQTGFFFRYFCWLFYSRIYTLELFLSFRYFFYSCERARVCRMAGPS